MMEKIVLIEPRSSGVNEYSMAKLPRLALPMLGSVIKNMDQDRKVTVFCEELNPIDWDQVKQADLVGFSSLTPTAPRAYRLAQKIQDIPVVMGGPHVSFEPEEALECGADYVLRKEAERSFKKLIEALESGNTEQLKEIEGLSYKDREGKYQHNPNSSHLIDLDSLPWPDLTLIDGFEKMKRTPIQTTRGCPHNCNFCQVIQLFGRKYRMRDPEDITREIESYKETPLRSNPIFFYDDNFTANFKRTKRLINLIEKRNLAPNGWSAQARIGCAQNTELLKRMAATGCTRLYIGIESINRKVLAEFNKKQSVEDIKEGIKKIREEGISVHGMFMLGAENDTKQAIKKTIDFARKHVDTAQFLALTPIPGTTTYKNLMENGRLLREKLEKFLGEHYQKWETWELFDGHHTIFEPNNEPNNFNALELQKQIIEANKKFYTWSRFIKNLFSNDSMKWKSVLWGKWLMWKWWWSNRNREFVSFLNQIS